MLPLSFFWGREASHVLRGEPKLRWHVSGSSSEKSQRPLAIAHFIALVRR